MGYSPRSKIYLGILPDFLLDRIESPHAHSQSHYIHYVLLVHAGYIFFLFLFFIYNRCIAQCGCLQNMSDNNETGETVQGCRVCGTPTTNKCSSCKSVSYCSKDHQKEDWKNHKDACRPFEVSFLCSGPGLIARLILMRNSLGTNNKFREFATTDLL